MGVSCGVDIIEIDRVKESIEASGISFLKKVFTENEIEYCESKKAARFQSYAVRFAAKEAVSKAFGTGISGGIGWKDIEIMNDGLGKPRIILYGRAKELFDGLNPIDISISLSHSKEYAVAYAVIQTK